MPSAPVRDQRREEGVAASRRIFTADLRTGRSPSGEAELRFIRKITLVGHPHDALWISPRKIIGTCNPENLCAPVEAAEPGSSSGVIVVTSGDKQHL